MESRSTTVDGIPALITPPPGYEVDFASPSQHHSTAAYVVFGFGFPLSTLFFLQYAYVKLRLYRKADFQLTCLATGWIFSVAFQAIVIRAFSTKTLGVHGWEMPLSHAEKGLYYLFTLTVLNTFVTVFCKTSLGLFYCQLFPQTWWKWVSWSILIFVASYNVVIFFTTMFGCYPFESNWNTDTPGICINRPALYLSKASFEAFSDLMLFFVPIPIIVGLKIPTLRKICLILSLGMGLLTFITAIIRISLLVPSLDSNDLTWTMSGVIVVMLAECHLLVICATLPTIRRFFSHFAPRLFGESQSSTGNSFGSRNCAQDFMSIGKRRTRKVFAFETTMEDKSHGSHSSIRIDPLYYTRSTAERGFQNEPADVVKSQEAFCLDAIMKPDCIYRSFLTGNRERQGVLQSHFSISTDSVNVNQFPKPMRRVSPPRPVESRGQRRRFPIEVLRTHRDRPRPFEYSTAVTTQERPPPPPLREFHNPIRIESTFQTTNGNEPGKRQALYGVDVSDFRYAPHMAQNSHVGNRSDETVSTMQSEDSLRDFGMGVGRSCNTFGQSHRNGRNLTSTVEQRGGPKSYMHKGKEPHSFWVESPKRESYIGGNFI